MCVPSLFGQTICGLSCTHQERRATIAKVPAVGAAQRDKTGKVTVSEAPLNIIRLVDGLGSWVCDYKSGD